VEACVKRKTTLTEQLTSEQAEMIRLRTYDLVRACMYDPNIIDCIARSCYVQGLLDGVQVADQRPEIIPILRDMWR
jgi:hypothetical protein